MICNVHREIQTTNTTEQGLIIIATDAICGKRMHIAQQA